jgi:hypothetical protein
MEDLPPRQDGGARDVATLIESVPFLKLILSSAGIIGVLVAVGYLVEAARESLLGITLPAAHSTSEYASTGGEFFVAVLGLMWREVAVTLVCFAVIVAVALAASRARSKIPPGRKSWLAACAAVVLLFSLKALWLDRPYVSMSDLLTQPPLCDTAKLTEDEQRQHAAWERFMCSKNDASLQNRIRCTAPRWLRFVPGSAKTKHGRLSIEQEFTINLFATGLLAYFAIALYASPGAQSQSPVVAVLLRLLLLLITVINILALPFIYGKVIRSTRFPSGQIVFETIDQDMKPVASSKAVLLIAADDKNVTAYDLEEHEFLQLSRNRVRTITASGSEDIVVKQSAYFLDRSPCPPGGSP